MPGFEETPLVRMLGQAVLLTVLAIAALTLAIQGVALTRMRRHLQRNLEQRRREQRRPKVVSSRRAE